MLVVNANVNSKNDEIMIFDVNKILINCDNTYYPTYLIK